MAVKTMTPLSITLAFLCMAESECEEHSCYNACAHLVECENQWLEGEREPAMTEEAADRYFDRCTEDCSKHGEHFEFECVQETSYEALLEGRCSD